MSRLPKLTATKKYSQISEPKSISSTIQNENFETTSKSMGNFEKVSNRTFAITKRRDVIEERLRFAKRIKTTADFISFNKQMPPPTDNNNNNNNVGLKRPGPQITSKFNKPMPVLSRKLPSKSNANKPPPYDFKARYVLLKQEFDAFKEEHYDLNTNYEEISVEYRNLHSSYIKAMEELSDTTQRLQNISEIHDAEMVTLTCQLNESSVLNERLKTGLNSATETISAYKHRLQTLEFENPELKSKLKSTTSKLESTTLELEKNRALVDDLNVKLYQLDLEKRRLHNDIQDLKGNIRVYCRVRPRLHSERFKLKYKMKFLDDNSLELNKEQETIEPTGRVCLNKYDFSFDRIFPPESTQEDIFYHLAELVQSALDGYNICVFTYGQTGSGKTYTMEGFDGEFAGMIPRAIDLIFKTIDKNKPLGWQYEVKAQFLEIYNETIVDLLNPNDGLSHEIKMVDAKSQDVYVTNLNTQKIESAEELLRYTKNAQRNRAVGQTINNERSSRSHGVFKITLTGLNAMRNEKLNGSLNLIDLAGSERLHSNEFSACLNETKNINKSLANLSNVILALVQKSEYIPYRNSKLTHLLMPSLGGNSKTLMLVNIAPLEECFYESLNSLRFASRVNQCKSGHVKRNKFGMH